MANLTGQISDATLSGVLGENTGQGGVGVFGLSDSGDGVRATSTTGNGLSARSRNSVAIFAESENGFGVAGIGHKEPGVSGVSDGVRAVSASGNGLSAFGGDNGVGIFAQASAKRTPAAGKNPTAGFFDGDVEVTGDVRLVGGQDLAETFRIEGSTAIEPGMVMVITNEGALRASTEPYDHRVAGVVSGAGSFRPGLILGGSQSEIGEPSIALAGRVECLVDADRGPIALGDLLTTSATPGHAMLADDRSKAFGAVLGKALRAAGEGRVLIPVLVSLQ